MSQKIRNIAIVAHVDHGKTTLDRFYYETKWISGVIINKLKKGLWIVVTLEKERGITILAKPASIKWKETRINIIDTPGHSDFSSEVERVT